MTPSDSANSIISKVSSIVVSDDEEHVSETPYLESREPNSRLANFLRSELELGKVLGKGRFTETREIRRVDRDLHYRPASIGEEKGRMEIWENAKTKGRCNFTIKRISKDLKSEREVERSALGLAIEANYLSRLNHQNIVQLKGMVESTFKVGPDTYDYHAMITNRITETLDERIDYWNDQDSISLKSDFILHLKTDYAFQIADALSYLHDRRIVFRNLTLSSIGFTSSDTIQLVNFDCVKEIPEGQPYLRDGFKGNHTYMALEMYEGKEYDFKVDCFSWGICFYEMLTQQPAFQSTTNEEALIREHGWCPSLETVDFVPDGLLDLLEDAWETDTDDRFTMKDIRGQLEWILFGNDEDDSCVESESGDTSMEEECGYLSMGMDDMSALGLDLDESCNFDMGADQVLYAAIGFSNTRDSFIPSNLLLEEEEEALKPAPVKMGPPRRLSMAEMMPKIEYTKQYRGLRIETIPPPAFVPPNVANKANRRRSMVGGNRKGSIPCAA